MKIAYAFNELSYHYDYLVPPAYKNYGMITHPSVTYLMLLIAAFIMLKYRGYKIIEGATKVYDSAELCMAYIEVNCLNIEKRY